jgi:ABC-type Zn uptake system ZnuABC Zn-binding protein ZnuA
VLYPFEGRIAPVRWLLAFPCILASKIKTKKMEVIFIMKRILPIALVIALALAGLAGCGTTVPATTKDGEKISVVATIFPPYDFTRAIAGDKADISMLLLPGCATETEASPATVKFLIDKIKEENIPVVFHIEISNEKMADTISEATGVKVLLLHVCHNISQADFAAGKTYLDFMTANVTALKEALWCPTILTARSNTQATSCI